MLSHLRPRTLRWRVYLLVWALLVLVLVTAAAATLTWLHASDIGAHVRTVFRPAQQSVAELGKSYVDMESGERGFLLTRDESFLQPYVDGQADAARQTQELRRLLTEDPVSLGMLDGVDAAFSRWQSGSAMPEIASARAGGSGATVADLATSKETFDVLRTRTTELQGRISDLTAVGLESATSAQATARTVTITCALVALVLGAATILILRRSLALPLTRLVGQVRRVADGELGARVDPAGPDEVAEVGRAVETMRARTLAEIELTAQKSQQLARLEETDRIARELGDTVIKRLFAIGLNLQSGAARHPGARVLLTRTIADLDQAINRLRGALYGQIVVTESLGIAVQNLVDDLENGLGVVPELVLTGDLDHDLPEWLAVEVPGVLGDALRAVGSANSGGPVEIALSRDDFQVRLRVRAPAHGGGPDQRLVAELLERALLHGGGSEVGHEEERVVIQWWVPV
ncbi:HAMP domain-containing protein [Amycolatopsis acidicola]|uniref:histidine kinase n=1 Tax=Amycolatopsis acidicola TaxID=2596893 RepID=A0A5N0USD9_9PSEU|nr:CHASE3 domain-containing protein [Amycolatopsis acidicola]KAA9154704.1 HAMP domain-containing protein [Amycolatopsis acidicola]